MRAGIWTQVQSGIEEKRRWGVVDYARDEGQTTRRARRDDETIFQQTYQTATTRLEARGLARAGAALSRAGRAIPSPRADAFAPWRRPVETPWRPSRSSTTMPRHRRAARPATGQSSRGRGARAGRVGGPLVARDSRTCPHGARGVGDAGYWGWRRWGASSGVPNGQGGDGLLNSQSGRQVGYRRKHRGAAQGVGRLMSNPIVERPQGNAASGSTCRGSVGSPAVGGRVMVESAREHMPVKRTMACAYREHVSLESAET